LQSFSGSENHCRFNGTEDTGAIESAQEQFSCRTMEEHGLCKGKFQFLGRRNEMLAQEKGAMIEDSLALVRIVADHLKKVSRNIGKMGSRKWKSFLDKSSGYETICTIPGILTGESFISFNIEEELIASDLVHYEYAPIVYADVERSFSKYGQ
jgi:hypothetical protein